MRRIVPCTLFLPLVLVQLAQASPPPYNWTLSASDTDPFENTATPTFGVRTIHLWLEHASLGMQLATFAILGDVSVLSVTSRNGFQVDLQSGETTHLFCPGGPLIAADILILDLPGELCFAPAAADGANCTQDCSAGDFHENSFVGWRSDGDAPCIVETWVECSPWPTPVNEGVSTSAFGRVKASYR